MLDPDNQMKIKSTYALLGDVMGNGKTVQIFCIIFVVWKISGKKAIYSCPASLVPNVLAEFKKVITQSFLTGLSIPMHQNKTKI